MNRTAMTVLRQALLPAEVSDKSLIQAYLDRNDREAFEILIARYGPVVYSVCRNVLGHSPEADDAFQATFLVLIRKVSQLNAPERIGGWLLAVATRTAAHARRIRLRHLRREQSLLDHHESPSASEWDSEWVGLLHAEIARLSEPLRTAIVACELSGLDRSTAAMQLGIPEGTLSSRLAAGRKILALRLSRRNLAYAIALAAWSTTQAAVPENLQKLTHELLMGSPISPSVFLLAKGITMTHTKLLFTASAALGFLAALAVGMGQAGDPVPASAVVQSIVPVLLPIHMAGPTVKDAPPVVVKTVPQAGAEDIDAATTTEIRVTFSKEMMNKTWSWGTAGDHGVYPDDGGEVYYDKDKKTCVLPVKLKPGTTYAIWINSARYDNFKDASGKSAVPYLLVFQTKK